MKTQIINATLELAIGDIANRPNMEAVVNAANAEMQITAAGINFSLWGGILLCLVGGGWLVKELV